VDLGQYEVGRLEIRKGYPASWDYGRGMRIEDRFKVYGLLHALFHVRRIQWKSSLLAMPAWLNMTFSGLVFLLAMHDALNDKTFGHEPHFYLRFGASMIVGVFLLSLVLYRMLFEQSFVVFRRVHDDQGLRKKWMEWRPYVIAAIVGGVVKGLVDVIRKAIEK
jgi:hypothetical protein